MKKPEMSPFRKVCELLGLLILIGTLVYIISNYAGLPAQVPGHYNAAGEVTDFNGKWVVWLLFGLEAFIYVLLTALIFFPRQTENPNLPWEIDMSYKKNVASETVSVICECKLLSTAMFSYMCWAVIVQRPMSPAPILILCALIILSVVLHMINISKYKK